VRHATSSAFKDILDIKVTKSRRSDEPHNSSAAWATRQPWRVFTRMFVAHGRQRSLNRKCPPTPRAGIYSVASIKAREFKTTHCFDLPLNQSIELTCPLLPPLGVAPAGEIAEREHQETAQHHVIDHHQGVCGFHAICSRTAVCTVPISTPSMCDTPQARHSKI
jgi:hypothetical protein